MPACTLHLLSLTIPTDEFLTLLRTQTTLKPLTTARVIRWIITPTKLSTHLTQHPWDLLLTFPTTTWTFPASLQKHISAEWRVEAGVPSRLLQDFKDRNNALLYPDANTTVPRSGELDRSSQDGSVGDSAQNLELSKELVAWIHGPGKVAVPGAVSMLNLLAFREGSKEDYLRYGKAFSESIGSRRGGQAKIVGTVIGVSGLGEELSVVDEGMSRQGREKVTGGWEEVAIAHYPSIEHFGDMLASGDYQAVNHKYRVPSLEDTFILCTNEVGIDVGQGGGGGASKL